jgi:hypothetical protein
MMMPFSSKTKEEQKEEKYCVELDENLYEWLKEMWQLRGCCDLTIDVELNGPSRIVLSCNEYEIEIQLGVDAPAPKVQTNRGASAGLGGQAPQGMQGGGMIC